MDLEMERNMQRPSPFTGNTYKSRVTVGLRTVKDANSVQMSAVPSAPLWNQHDQVLDCSWSKDESSVTQNC